MILIEKNIHHTGIDAISNQFVIAAIQNISRIEIILNIITGFASKERKKIIETDQETETMAIITGEMITEEMITGEMIIGEMKIREMIIRVMARVKNN